MKKILWAMSLILLIAGSFYLPVFSGAVSLNEKSTILGLDDERLNTSMNKEPKGILVAGEDVEKTNDVRKASCQ